MATDETKGDTTRGHFQTPPVRLCSILCRNVTLHIYNLNQQKLIAVVWEE